MKVNNAVKYSALFFLIFIFGVLFFVTTINKSLDRKTEIIKDIQSYSTCKCLASTDQE